jgi:hypothetical protein
MTDRNTRTAGQDLHRVFEPHRRCTQCRLSYPTLVMTIGFSRPRPVIETITLRCPGVLRAEVDDVDAVAGVAVRVVGEHYRGGGAGFVDDLRDLKLVSGFAAAGRGADLHGAQR